VVVGQFHRPKNDHSEFVRLDRIKDPTAV